MIYNTKKMLQNNLNLIDKKILNITSTKFYNLPTAQVFKTKTLFHEGIQKLQVITNIASLSQERFVLAPIVQKVDNAVQLNNNNNNNNNSNNK